LTGWDIEHLDRRHDRAGFACGIPALDEWIVRYAGQNEKKGLSRTYVLTRPGEVRVFGYYSISTCQVSHESLPVPHSKGTSLKVKIPALLLGRLAVDATCQGQGLGDLLLAQAMRQSQDVADQVGILALTVDAIDDRARNYYLRRGFLSFLDRDDGLFLPVGMIRKLGLGPIVGRSPGADPDA